MPKMDTSAYHGLPQDWVYSPSIDLELKQYTLLGYLQRVKARFAERKLYPYLQHLQDHVKELRHLQQSKESVARNLSGPLIGFDLLSGGPVHERHEDDDVLKVIDEVIAFAVPGLVKVQAQGLDLRQELARHIHFAPVGLQPLYVGDGWLLLRKGKQARVYGYSISHVVGQEHDPGHLTINTRYVTTYTVGILHTYEHMKADLVQQHPFLPNPATFVFETELDIPHIETFVPLAKQLVSAHLAARPY